jgi:nucleoside-triphosphatase THEP1
MQNKIYVLTGKRGVGKTTSLNLILSDLRVYFPAIKGFRTYFNEQQLLLLEWVTINEETVVIARKTSSKSLKPDLNALHLIGDILKKETFDGSAFCADEIGFLESLSKNMQDGILQAITNSDFALITLRKADYPFLKKIKKMNNVKVYNLDEYDYLERKKIERDIIKDIRG